jgi:hypothetical protein
MNLPAGVGRGRRLRLEVVCSWRGTSRARMRLSEALPTGASILHKQVSQSPQVDIVLSIPLITTQETLIQYVDFLTLPIDSFVPFRG